MLRFRSSSRSPRVRQALAAAKAVAAPRPDEAIRLLTEANRVERDRTLERRLIELRAEAFQRMEWPTERAPWPDVDDLFPGELVPEIHRDELTVERVRSAIRHHGSLLVRGLYDAEQSARLVGDIDNAFDAFDARANGEERPEVAGWYVPFQHKMITDESRARQRRSGSVLAFESPPAMFDLIEVMHDVGVSQLARDYLGEAPTILGRKVTLRRLPHTATGRWHQDGAFMGADTRSLNAWVALTHCGDDAPGLDVVGRRIDHLLTTGGENGKDWGIEPEDAEAAGAGVIVRPIFEPGDALLFDQMLVHRTARDAGMPNGRYAIEMWFFAPSTYDVMLSPSDDGYSPRDQVPLVY